MFIRVIICTCLYFVTDAQIALPCLTPNYEPGFCVSLFSCPVLMKSLGTVQRSAIAFVKNSLCGNPVPDDVFVCCATLGNYYHILSNKPPCETTTQASITVEIQNAMDKFNNGTPSPTTQTPVTKPSTESSGHTQQPTQKVTSFDKTTQNTSVLEPTKAPNATVLQHREYVKSKLLPSRKYCGLQHTDDRFYNESATALDEFPWLVHVVYLPDEDDDPYQFLDRCNGVLLNRRYVLTSEYCGTDLRGGSVRLGQYYTNQTVSCIENPDFPECTEAWLEVEVEEDIHRISGGKGSVHDFALLRLAKNVTFSDFIRPICVEFDEPKPSPEFYSISGWGQTANLGTIKKRLNYRQVNLSECTSLDEISEWLADAQQEALGNASKEITPVCLLPRDKDGELACTGDEAGPIMYSRRSQWFLHAIVTRVYYKPDVSDVRCSNKLPIAGSKVTRNVLDWIMDNMRP